ncbi:MAG: lipopolysaccharide heptosyltransferase I [Variibacter sp.]
MADVLFVKTSSLGDVIHHMPAVTDARRQRPDARISWVVEENYAPLVRLHPAVDEIIPVAGRRWRKVLRRAQTWREIDAFLGTMRARTYDTIIDAQGLLRSALIARVARGPHHGYGFGSVRETLASFLYDVRHDVARNKHAIDRNRELTARALGYTVGGDVDYGLRRDLTANPSRRYALLLHGSARAEKEWPPERWVAVGRALADGGMDVVLSWGSVAERARSESLATAIGAAAHVADRGALDVMAQRVAGAAIVVGLDTGLTHLAAAFRVPLVSIFVKSQPRLTGPRGSGPMETVGDSGQTPAADTVIAACQRVLRA